jgi:hypothetical protein
MVTIFNTHREDKSRQITSRSVKCNERSHSILTNQMSSLITGLRKREPTSFLEKRIRDLNISTSFVSSGPSSDTSSDCGDIQALRYPAVTRGLSRMGSRVSFHGKVDAVSVHDQTECRASDQIIADIQPKKIEACEDKLGSQIMTSGKDSKDDLRQGVLEIVGDMLDSQLLSESEATEAVGQAMKSDNTYELMGCLLRSRKTLDGKAGFLRMWLRGQKSTAAAPPPIHAPYRTTSEEPELVKPRTNYESFGRKIPSASPPLMPIALQFPDNSPCDSPTDDRGPTPSILLSNPPSIIVKRASSLTPSTGEPGGGARLVFSNMGTDCAV